MDPASACPEEKAIALHCTAVERYSIYYLQDRSNDAKFGTIILRFAYSVGFILTFFMAPLFIELLFKILIKTFARPHTDTGNNPVGEQEPKVMATSSTEYDNYHYKPMFVAALIVSFMYSCASISIAFYHLPNNEFQGMKISFLIVLIAWLIVLDVFNAVYYIEEDSSNYCMKMILASLAVFSLGILAADVMLSLPPTILLLFAYPIDSSALLALHIAIFYCATMVLAVYFNKIHKWIIEHNDMTSRLLKILKILKVLN